MNEKGDYCLPIKYGHRVIELKKGMFAIHCDTVDEAAKALETVREMVLHSDFNSQLEAASKEIRNRFKTG